MTDRSSATGGASSAPGGAASPGADRAVGRPNLPRLPAHVGVMLGISAGTYGIMLAGATALQAATDSAGAAERAPIADAISDLMIGHERLAASLEAAGTQYEAASAAYDELVSALADYEIRIATLASQVGSVSREAAALPGSIATPRPIPVPAPVTARKVASAPQLAPTPKPPTTTTTGAS